MIGRTIRLEPLEERHASDLARHATVETFRWFPIPQFERIDEAAMLWYVRHALSLGDAEAFAVILNSTGEAIGSTCYLNIRPQHLGLEIGMTWYGERHRATKVNQETKLLLLTEAFENRGCERVQLKTDFRNLQSRAAIAKLGAKQDGILRKHVRMSDGFMRDTVMFSIIREEWPGVREGLLARVAGG